jgi:hypothetical protein
MTEERLLLNVYCTIVVTLDSELEVALGVGKIFSAFELAEARPYLGLEQKTDRSKPRSFDKTPESLTIARLRHSVFCNGRQGDRLCSRMALSQ